MTLQATLTLPLQSGTIKLLFNYDANTTMWECKMSDEAMDYLTATFNNSTYAFSTTESIKVTK